MLNNIENKGLALKVSLAYSTLATLFLVTLKLLNIIHWAWIWVLSPLWLPYFIFISFILMAIVIFFTVGMIKFTE